MNYAHEKSAAASRIFPNDLFVVPVESQVCVTLIPGGAAKIFIK